MSSSSTRRVTPARAIFKMGQKVVTTSGYKGTLLGKKTKRPTWNEYNERMVEIPPNTVGTIMSHQVIRVRQDGVVRVKYRVKVSVGPRTKAVIRVMDNYLVPIQQYATRMLMM